MNLILTILIIFFSTIQTIVGDSNCLSSFIKIENNEFLVLSDNETDANTARDICLSSGGSLARITSQSSPDEIRNFLHKNLISNVRLPVIVENELCKLVEFQIKIVTHDRGQYLNEVKIYPTPDISGFKTFKFRKNNVNNPGNLENRKEKLKSFYLYSNNETKRTFRTKVLFCKYGERSLISEKCIQGWKNDFHLYGETSRNTNAIKIYHYKYLTHPWSSNLFLKIQRNQSYFPLSFIYIPDISVFIGARSNVSQNKWYWNNNTQVNNTMFPESNSSMCQQMTWPLTYNDGINLRPKQCDGSSNFVCQIKFEALVSPLQCNASFLQVSWKAYDLHRITRKAENLMVQIEVNGTINEIVPFRTNLFNISGLQPQSFYEVKVSLKTNCSILLSSTSRVSTSFGVPESVINAQVQDTENNTQSCVIQWKHIPEQLNQTEFYKISVYIPTYSQYEIRASSVQLISGILQYRVDLSSFPPNLTAKFTIQAFSCEGGGEISNVSGSCTTPLSSSPSINITAIVGSAIGVLLLFLVGLCFLRKTNQKNKTMNLQVTTTTTEIIETNVQDSIVNIEADDDQNEMKTPINHDLYENVPFLNKKDEINKLKNIYLEESLNNFKKSKMEFDKICNESLLNEPEHKVASDPENSKKNRYRNIYPYDHSRVKLFEMNYINASYIEGWRPKRSYIATQGAKFNTVNDFWEMVWKENSKTIVMLCNCVEKQKIKCEKYWPTLRTQCKYGKVSVKSTSERNFGGIYKRVFTVKFDQDEKEVIQFHYVSWPDHDIPLTTSGMHRLRNLVNNAHEKNQSKGRIVVHCSAGAGRTGTYIAIDNLIEEFNETGKLDVYNAVMKMRRNRKDMVQSNNQYVFVKKIVLEHFLHPTTELTRSNLLSQSSSTNWKGTIRNEYQRLFALTPNESNQVVESAYENCSPLIFSDDKNQVKITSNNQQYISTNAHYIENDRYPSRLIASSAPNIAQQFLDIIKQTNSKMVICLETLSSDPFLSILQRNDDVLNRFNLVVKQTTDHNNHVIINVTVEELEEKRYEFSFVHFHSWVVTNSPPDVSYFVDVITKMKTSMEIHDFSTALVYCRNGRSRSGLFLALAILIEQIKSTDTVDVFRTVKDLREMKPNVFETVDEYFLCYEMITKYCSLLS